MNELYVYLNSLYKEFAISMALAVVFGIIALVLGKNKTKYAFWWGFFLGIIGILIVIFKEEKKTGEDPFYQTKSIDDEILELKQKWLSGEITEDYYLEEKNRVIQHRR